MNIKYIDKLLRENLTKDRYIHSLYTAIEAKNLAKVYNVDTKKAYIAGLLHDCAKSLNKKQMQALLKNKGFSKEFLNCKTIMHAPAGAILAKTIYKIDDSEMLSAIEYHCYAKANMTMLEKIVFVADKIEKTRKYKGVEQLREIAYRDIDKALLISLNYTINKVTSTKGFLYSKTVDAQKYYLNIIENK